MTPARADTLKTPAIVLTLLLHAGVLGALVASRALSRHTPSLGKDVIVDAQLVRFGKPRDLSFLPHKEGHVKDKPPEIKVAKDLSALPHIDKEEKPKDVDPLKKTHAEQFKQLADDTDGVQPSQVGSLSGSRAGTASEAKGDPYIQQLMQAIGEAWTVPKTLSESQLANLTAVACLTISESGALSSYKIKVPSNNSQFDSSLQAALSTLKTLPAPPNRDVQGMPGKNLLSLAKRGLLCAEMSPPAK